LSLTEPSRHGAFMLSRSAEISQDFYVHQVPGIKGKALSHMDRGNQFHLVLRVVRNKWKDYSAFNPAGDEDRVASRATKSMVLRRDLNALPGLEGLEGLKIVAFYLQIEGPRISLYTQFPRELPFDPRDLGEIRSSPNPLDNFSSDLNVMPLSSSRRFSISDLPSD
jgi:hypothetical protein